MKNRCHPLTSHQARPIILSVIYSSKIYHSSFISCQLHVYFAINYYFFFFLVTKRQNDPKNTKISRKNKNKTKNKNKNKTKQNKNNNKKHTFCIKILRKYSGLFLQKFQQKFLDFGKQIRLILQDFGKIKKKKTPKMETLLVAPVKQSPRPYRDIALMISFYIMCQAKFMKVSFIS